jgi:hypothetical protein
MFKVEPHKGEILRCYDPGIGKQRALPFLRRRKIDFEDADLRKRVAIGEGVEAGSEDHVLPDAAGHRLGEMILGVAAARGHEGAEVAAHGVDCTLDVVLVPGADQAQSDGVIEHRGRIGDLMGSATNGHAQRGSAWFAGLHTLGSLRCAGFVPLRMDA